MFLVEEVWVRSQLNLFGICGKLALGKGFRRVPLVLPVIIIIIIIIITPVIIIIIIAPVIIIIIIIIITPVIIIIITPVIIIIIITPALHSNLRRFYPSINDVIC